MSAIILNHNNMSMIFRCVNSLLKYNRRYQYEVIVVDNCSSVDYYPNRAMRPDQFYRDDVAYLGTCGFVMRISVFDCTGGFDTAYDPTCFEDTDFSFQINNLGLKTVYCPLMDIMHFPHQTTKSGESSQQKLIKKNGDYFIQKWTMENPGLLRKAWSYIPG